MAAALSFEGGWLARAARGDRKARETLVRTYQDRVYRFLLRLSGNHDLALDLTQETFLRAFKALGRFEGDNPGPWLFKIANHLFLDVVRSKKPDSLEAAMESGFEPGGEDEGLEAALVAGDLAAALARLPVSWRQAVVLRHVEDLPYEEIAEILGVPLGTVKTWLYRGRDRLRILLEGGA